MLQQMKTEFWASTFYAKGILVGGDLENPNHTNDNPRKNLKDERG